MEQHTERLIRLAFYYVRDLQSAEDIVQDVFIKFYDNQQNYEERGELKAYLSKLVSNQVKIIYAAGPIGKFKCNRRFFRSKPL